MLITAAERDEDLAAELRSWVAEADASTNNVVSGSVHGSVVQGRDFTGPIHLS